MIFLIILGCVLAYCVMGAFIAGMSYDMPVPGQVICFLVWPLLLSLVLIFLMGVLFKILFIKMAMAGKWIHRNRLNPFAYIYHLGTRLEVFLRKL